MNKLFEEMIDMDIEALSRNATVSIKDLRKKEADLKELYELIHSNFISHVHKNPETFADAILLLKIAETLKRAGEITSKIGNRIVYVFEGRRIWS
jgi:Na+/phosphate symporter